MNLEFELIKPVPALADFVDFFWMLSNHSTEEREVVVLPDGRIDIFFRVSASTPFTTMLMGLGTEPSQSKLLAECKIFAVSFNLLAVEYILGAPVSDILNTARLLPGDFLEITESHLNNFEQFCTKVSGKLLSLLIRKVDERKRKLFKLIYETNGAMPVNELSEKACWGSRQINRYFNKQYGISLKAYCNILRFRASFPHLKEGKLFPGQNYTDQTHFIKEVKKFSGVVPKELAQNKDERFIHFTTLPKKD